MPESDAGSYREWLASPSISTTDSPEMVIAWNLGASLGLHPTRVLRSLRKERGYLAGEMEAVTAAVAADPDLVFRKAGVSRRVAFSDARPPAPVAGRWWQRGRRPTRSRP